MTFNEIGYALSKQVPDMRRGFAIQTRYGDVIIAPEDAAPFVAALETMLRERLANADSALAHD